MRDFLKREVKLGTFRTPWWVILSAVPLVLFVIISLVVFYSANRLNTIEQHGRLVTIYDGSSEKTVLSQAETIAGVLDQTGIEVDPSDIIEPSLDSELIASSYSVNIYRAKPAVVIDGESETRVVTAAQTGRTIAQSADVDLYDEDIATISRETDILTSSGAIMRVEVVRAVPVSLNFYGQTMQVRTQAATVEEFLSEKDLKVNDDDYVIPSRNTAITAGMEIRIWREGKNIVTVDEEVTFPTEEIQSNDHEVGYREVRTPGENGKRSVTYEVEIRNGIEAGREEIQSIIIIEPKTQVEVVGIKPKAPPVPSDPGANAALGHQMMLNYGFGEDQWPCLYNLWTRESGWRTNAGNPSSGAYGIPQSLPASKMASAGADYMTNPATQITWGLGYIKGRYGTPCGAWAHFTSRNWY